MELDEIEETYSKSVEEAGKEFVKGIQEKKETKELEKKYKEKLKEAREQYYKDITKKLKEKPKQKKKKKKKSNEIKPLQVVQGGYNLTAWQRLKLNTKLRFFKLRFRVHNARKKATPLWGSYAFLKLKLKITRAFKTIKQFIARTLHAIGSGLKKGGIAIKKGSIKVGKKIATLLKKVMTGMLSIFKKKKKEEKKEDGEKKPEKTEDTKSDTSEDQSK